MRRTKATTTAVCINEKVTVTHAAQDGKHSLMPLKRFWEGTVAVPTGARYGDHLGLGARHSTGVGFAAFAVARPASTKNAPARTGAATPTSTARAVLSRP